jgi:transcriptional regulator with XRE-family HTH domain
MAERLAEWLRVAIQERVWERGIGQADLARRAGLSEAMLSRILSGRRTASLESAGAILDALGLEVTIGPRLKQEEE